MPLLQRDITTAAQVLGGNEIAPTSGKVPGSGIDRVVFGIAR